MKLLEEWTKMETNELIAEHVKDIFSWEDVKSVSIERHNDTVFFRIRDGDWEIDLAVGLKEVELSHYHSLEFGKREWSNRKEIEKKNRDRVLRKISDDN